MTAEPPPHSVTQPADAQASQQDAAALAQAKERIGRKTRHLDPASVKFDCSAAEQAFEVIRGDSHMVILPSEGGYISATTDQDGIDRINAAKERSQVKPVGVICSSVQQIEALADLNNQSLRLCTALFENNIPVNLVLPWKTIPSREHLHAENFRRLVQCHQGTTHFKIRPRSLVESLARRFWNDSEPLLVFTTSANITGTGNSYTLEQVPMAMKLKSSLIVECDASITVHEPITNVSLVNAMTGALTLAPYISRKGQFAQKIRQMVISEFRQCGDSQ